MVVVVGLVPAGLVQFFQPFPGRVWGLLVLTGMFEGIYHLGLLRGYAAGDFTVVYPVARALPILMLAVVDVVRGAVPTLLGWIGIGLIVVGCVAMPLGSLGRIRIARQHHHALGWAVVAALGTAGYTVIDKLAADMIVEQDRVRGLAAAGCYMVFIAVFTIPFLGVALKLLPKRPEAAVGISWRRAAWLGMIMYGAYWLVIMAYQLTAHTSYIVAVRQFSIVLGVVAGGILFGESARLWRTGAACAITAGIICIGLSD